LRFAPEPKLPLITTDGSTTLLQTLAELLLEALGQEASVHEITTTMREGANEPEDHA
jgi:hypothetical protein